MVTENTRRIADLQRDLAANPGSRQFYQLGELLRRDGHAAEAAEVLRSGLGHHPRYVAAWVSLGRACIEAGESTEAVSGLREALALDPGNPVAWRLLGEAYLALGQRPRALEAMAHCLELVPGDAVLQAAVDALSSDAAAPEPAAAAEEPSPAVVPAPGLMAAVPAAPEPEAPPFPAAPAEEPFGGSAPAPVVEPAPAPPAETAAPFAQPTPAPAAEPPEGRTAVARAEEFMVGAAAAAGPPALAAVVEPASAPLVGFEFEPEAPPAPVAAMPTAVTPPPVAPAVEPPAPEAAFEEAFPAPAGAGLAQPPPEAFLAESAAAPPVPAALPDSDLFTVPETDQAPVLLRAVLQASAAQAATEPVQPPASLTLARLYVQQQALGEAVAVLERLLEREPANVVAADLLALVRDMMVPLPEEPPPLDPRERKIAALQRWLASLTLGEERAQR
jgi:cytochrome c-type biogenesis protein CcmH/NrfG